MDSQGVKLFFVVFPVAISIRSFVGVTINLVKTRLERHQMVSLDTLQNEANYSLSNAQDYTETAALLFQFLADYVPIAGLSLLVYDRLSGQFSLLAEHSPQNAMAKALLGSDGLLFRLKTLEPNVGVVVPNILSGRPESSHLFCLSLAEDAQQVTILILYVPSGVSYSSSQIEVINRLTPKIADSIERIRLLGLVSDLKKALRKEQSRIARYLHDSISGNLAYIHLKLDQLSKQESSPEIRTLRDLAVETYERVRSLLTELDPVSEPLDLTPALYKTVRDIGERANFNAHFENIGKPRKLPPIVERQILYVARELLRNVEKHARARQVTFKLIWAEDNLTIEFSDDGQGFDVSENRFESGHLGLRIIQEIAEELNGRLTLTSSEEGGTKVVLRIPSGREIPIAGYDLFPISYVDIED